MDMRSTPTTAVTDQRMVRRANELLILEHLRERVSIPLSDISNETGLSWRTTNIVAEDLVAAGWLRESAAEGSGARGGRPARTFQFAADVGHVASIDIASAAVSVVLADLAGKVLHREEQYVAPGGDATDRLAEVAATMTRALDHAGLVPEDIWSTTIATSGVVDPAGTITKSVVLPGWGGRNLSNELSQKVGAGRIHVENDCNLAALAEHWYGEHPGDLIYLLIGTRLGVGLILHGELHRGTRGAAGEIGEIAELGWNSAAEILAAAVPTAGATDRETAAEAVFTAARDGDAIALAAVDAFADKVARGLIPMVLTIDPSAVLIGGSFSHATDLLIPRLNERLRRNCVDAPVIDRSSIGNDAVGLGALRLALEAVLDSMADLDSTVPLTPAAIRSRLTDDDGSMSASGRRPFRRPALVDTERRG